MCWNPSSKTFTASWYLWSVETISFSLIGLPFFLPFCIFDCVLICSYWGAHTNYSIHSLICDPCFTVLSHCLWSIFSILSLFGGTYLLPVSCISSWLIPKGARRWNRRFYCYLCFCFCPCPLSFLGLSAFLASILSTYLWQEFEVFFSWIFQLCYQVSIHIRSTTYDKELYGVLHRTLMAWWPQHSNGFESSSANNVKMYKWIWILVIILVFPVIILDSARQYPNA